MSRFVANANAAAGARNRGYDDALREREKRPPEDTKLRAAYLSGYRRGGERRAEITNA